MYSIENSINHWDLGLACIVCIGYISGKVWMYYKQENNDRGNRRN